MKLKFMCSAHREHLINEPSRAVAFFTCGLDTAQVFCDTKSWMEALPHAGCAFETSDIILTMKSAEKKKAIEYMTSSTVILAFILLKLGKVEDARDVYWSTITRLELELSEHSAEYSDLHQSLRFLCNSIESLIANYHIPQYTLGGETQVTNGSIH